MLGFPQIRRSEQGFTLVELAIVLVIIGLLITGLLKGAELINNARVKSMIQQVRSLDAAITTFRDNYRFMPGDIPNPAVRLPNCTAPCSTAAAGQTAGNNIVGADANTVAVNFTAAAVANDERLRFFTHMAAADLIGGINLGGTAQLQYGDAYLATAMGNSGYLAFTTNGAAAIGASVAASRAGLYIATSQSPTTASGAATAEFRPVDAQTVDLKLDDGNPTLGSVVASPAAAGVCWTAAVGVTPAFYTTTNTTGCDIVSRVQN